MKTVLDIQGFEKTLGARLGVDAKPQRTQVREDFAAMA
jgi:hypothetical protein